MNLFKIMQSIRSLAQAGKIDYQGAIKYLNDLGVQMDGIVKQALDNVFKKGKARDPEFGDTVVKMQIDEQGIPFNPNTLKSIEEKRLGIHPDSDIAKSIKLEKKGKKLADSMSDTEIELRGNFPKASDDEIKIMLEKEEGIGNLFEETKKVAKEPKYGTLDYDRIAKQEGVDVEEIRGKSFREIIEYLAAVRDKADGGRVGFQQGGWADDLTGQAAAIYQSMNLGGHSDVTIQNTLRSLGYWDGNTGGGDGDDGNIINTQQSIIPGGDSRPTGPESYTQTWTSEGIPAAAQSTSFVNSPESVNALNQKIYDYMGTQMGPFSNDPLRNQFETLTQEDFMTQNPEYFSQGNVQPERTGLMGMWDKTKDFFSGLGSPKIRGQLGTRLANQRRLPLPASMASWSMSPFNVDSRNYNRNFEAQLNFLEGEDGMIGRDTTSGHLKYGPESVLAGKNVFSMFGSNNYEVALDKEINRLERLWERQQAKVGKVKGWDQKRLNDWYDKFLGRAYKERDKAQILGEKRIEDEKKVAQDFMTKNPDYGNQYDPSKDHSRDGGYGHTASSPGATTGSAARSRHSRSEDLGFSDIRLKDNVELIGQSPSNINIYKFNYLNDPTVYQGVMAHEVPWASVKHSSGYMMVDYNQIDVQFKLYDVH